MPKEPSLPLEEQYLELKALRAQVELAEYRDKQIRGKRKYERKQHGTEVRDR